MAIITMSCNQKTFETEDELLAFITDEENGYIQHKSVNGYDFSLLYRPTDILVNQEANDNTSKEEIRNLREKYSRHLYFNLSMSKNNQELLSVAPKDRNEFGAMVNQLVFGMGNKVHLFTKSKDTLELIDFIYPRMYGTSKSTTIMFIYPREKELLDEQYLNLSIEDLGINTGEIKFKIDTKKIFSEPQLEL